MTSYSYLHLCTIIKQMVSLMIAGVPDLTAGLFKGDGQEILNYNVNQQSEMISKC